MKTYQCNNHNNNNISYNEQSPRKLKYHTQIDLVIDHPTNILLYSKYELLLIRH